MLSKVELMRIFSDTLGIMMTLAWVFCCTVGVVVARYNKDMVPEKKLFGTKYWFQVRPRNQLLMSILLQKKGFVSIDSMCMLQRVDYNMLKSK